MKIIRYQKPCGSGPSYLPQNRNWQDQQPPELNAEPNIGTRNLELQGFTMLYP
jgi:hypothetical protein